MNIKKLVDNGEDHKLKKLENIFRLQDDLSSSNDEGLFGNILGDIYPTEMLVNCTNVSPRKWIYLDLSIAVSREESSELLYMTKAMIIISMSFHIPFWTAISLTIYRMEYSFHNLYVFLILTQPYQAFIVMFHNGHG